MAFVTFGVDLQGLAFVYEVSEHFVEDVAEVAVSDGCDGVGSVADDIVIVSHDVEILKPGHLPVDCFEVHAVCLFPIFALVITSIVGVCLLYVVD